MTTKIFDTNGFPVFNLIVPSIERGYDNDFNVYKQKNTVLEKSEMFPDLKVGDTISFVGGYDSNIRFVSKILGFDCLGWAYVLWECYWYPINLSARNFSVYCESKKY